MPNDRCDSTAVTEVGHSGTDSDTNCLRCELPPAAPPTDKLQTRDTASNLEVPMGIVSHYSDIELDMYVMLHRDMCLNTPSVAAMINAAAACACVCCL